MTKYNKAIITKSDSGNVTRFDFSKTDIKTSIAYNDLSTLREELVRQKKEQKTLSNQIKITETLLNNNIKSFEEISYIVDTKTKAFLEKNYIEVLTILPKAPLEELEESAIFSFKNENNNEEQFKISIAKKYQKEANKLSIIEPTTEQLQIIRKKLAFRKFQPAPHDTKAWDLLEKTEQPIYTQDNLNKITHEETLEEYYKFEKFRINKEIRDQYENDYLKNLSNQQLKSHYEFVITTLKEEVEHTNKVLDFLKNILYETENSRGLATPNDLRRATMGIKQDLKWRDIDNQHRDKVKELLKSTAPEILDRLEDDEDPNEIISQFIGTKLAKKELRILKTLRALVDKAFNLEEIQDYSHKTRIYTANFYKEYGLKPRKEGGYEDNQTRAIREILFSGNSNLTKRTFFYNKKNQKVMVTAFVLKLDWETDNNYFEVMLDEIIFVKDKSDEYSYYYENLQGLNRLISFGSNSPKLCFVIYCLDGRKQIYS